MRRLMVGLLWILVAAGCDDTVQDVASDQLLVSEAPPDTIVVENGVTVQLYGPDHRRAVERSSELLERPAIQNTAEVGAVLLFDQIVVAHASVEDGRDAEMTLIPLVSPTGEELGGIVVVRKENEELIIALSSESRDDDEFVEESKEGGPHAVDKDCLMWARLSYSNCMSNCSKLNPVGCRIVCFLHAVVTYIGCLFLATYV